MIPLVLWAQRALTTPLGRKLLGGSVTLLLSVAVFAGWHFMAKHKGQQEATQECVQKINQATVDALQRELVWQQAQMEELAKQIAVRERAINKANQRRREAESSLDLLQRQMEEQRETDETYLEWSDSALPDGVADRLRQAAGSETGDTD